MRIILAPMEGVVDHTVRAMLTSIGGIDRCVTEFVRVTDQKFPRRLFYRLCPELANKGCTPSGVPVFVQLLGGKPEPMAWNAQKAAELGAPGIDINFGCPAKQVNKNDGGSVILKEPDRVFNIVSTVRSALPRSVPLTVKCRLGFSDAALFNDIANAIIDAGASELAVHARTRMDGYKPPAYWHELKTVAAKSPIPLVANGEIWNTEHYRECVVQSGCEDIMLGRGILACPDLARQIKQVAANKPVDTMPWWQVVNLLQQFCAATFDAYEPKYVGNRLKQWLGYLRLHYSEAADLFERVKRLRVPQEIVAAIEAFASISNSTSQSINYHQGDEHVERKFSIRTLAIKPG